VTAITLDHFTSKLEQLKQDMDAGNFESGEYDQRLARLIQELRERRIDAERAEITAVLVDLLNRQVITPSVKDHIEKRLGVRMRGEEHD
jgi:hypothetical protein